MISKDKAVNDKNSLEKSSFITPTFFLGEAKLSKKRYFREIKHTFDNETNANLR